MTFAHVAGVPVEELLPAAIPVAAAIWNAARVRLRNAQRRYTAKSRPQSSVAAPR